MTKRYDTTKHWYAIHTYSGYEEKVAESIRQRADSLDMADKIFQVLVPKEKMIEIKNGKRKVVEKRIFQGYVLVEMKLSEDAWYIVRNTPSVTGFVGSGTEPTPINDDEMDKISKRMGLEQPKHKIDFQWHGLLAKHPSDECVFAANWPHKRQHHIRDHFCSKREISNRNKPVASNASL